MNELDVKILELFNNIINSGAKYLDKIGYNESKLIYKIDNKEVRIILYNSEKNDEISNSFSNINSMFVRPLHLYRWNFGMLHTDVNENVIAFKIVIDGKAYFVPKLERVEHARILDKIDRIIKEKESQILNSVCDYVITDSIFLIEK